MHTLVGIQSRFFTLKNQSMSCKVRYSPLKIYALIHENELKLICREQQIVKSEAVRMIKDVCCASVNDGTPEHSRVSKARSDGTVQAEARNKR